MLHSESSNVVSIERWAARRPWGRIGPRSFRAFVAPVYGWVAAQWSAALNELQREWQARRWDGMIAARDAYAETHGGVTREGFAIPGEVAAAARGER